MGVQLAEDNADLFLEELRTFQTQDDPALREIVLFGFQQKLVELLHTSDSSVFVQDKSAIHERVEELYQSEKIEHRGLDIVTYSNMKKAYCLSESDSLVSDLKDLVSLINVPDLVSFIPLELYRYYFLSLMYRVGGVIEYLTNAGMDSYSKMLNNMVLNEINKMSKSESLGAVIINECHAYFINDTSELHYDLNLSAMTLKKKGV
ncbi:hypothetical protein SJI19_16790 [Acerihabitans sp. TG2]|uniref:hypothetical protein n=1 Tax=Acerihabitans sp. TG2 TaxID=3096008 RepID=UPI002B233101|nr:hypothetical protein [Acerihabitans sp. TG2]MEA9392183.1 hypothetical protein [Acerihabitans sp. TG2]